MSSYTGPAIRMTSHKAQTILNRDDNHFKVKFICINRDQPSRLLSSHRFVASFCTAAHDIRTYIYIPTTQTVENAISFQLKSSRN